MEILLSLSRSHFPLLPRFPALLPLVLFFLGPRFLLQGLRPQIRMLLVGWVACPAALTQFRRPALAWAYDSFLVVSAEMKLACQGYLPWTSYAQRGKQVAVGHIPFGPAAARFKADGDWPTMIGKSHHSHRHMWPLTLSLTPHPATLKMGNCYIPVCLLRSQQGVTSPWPLTIGVKVTPSAHHRSGGTPCSSVICP